MLIHSGMSDEIIDLTQYLKQEPSSDLPRGSMALWGADGDRSRFALPLWRIIHLVQAERGLIVSFEAERPERADPFVVLDLGADPARTSVPTSTIPPFVLDDNPSLLDLGSDGIAVFLGADAGRIWTLLVDGGGTREEPLAAGVREDVLFLAGECAGLLFLRGLATQHVVD